VVKKKEKRKKVMPKKKRAWQAVIAGKKIKKRYSKKWPTLEDGKSTIRKA